MYVRNPGEMVHTGQKLYDLYSPDLLAAERDYQLALKQKDMFQKASVDLTGTIQALKQKLLRWGLSGRQLKELETQTRPSGNITIYSKSSGYLTRKMKEEGDQVSEGDPVINIANNDSLWVQAQMYDTELPLLHENTKVWVQIDGFGGQKLPGSIVFDNLVNEKDSRVHLLNIAIANPQGRLQPGMPAYVYLQTSKGSPGVVIPKSSVIYGQDADYVWVEQPDHAFERRKVRLGKDNTALVAVFQGVKAGEPVVSSGAYLLNSEYILKYGSGANLSGMQMSDMKMKGRSK
jgi:Cu(I)/Ag(I) efflux system membrane fusion protein